MPLMKIESPPIRDKLSGPIHTRAAARLAYGEIVTELGGCEDLDTLECYLLSIGDQLAQFAVELDWLWNGDGSDFIGLDREIKNAFVRVIV